MRATTRGSGTGALGTGVDTGVSTIGGGATTLTGGEGATGIDGVVSAVPAASEVALLPASELGASARFLKNTMAAASTTTAPANASGRLACRRGTELDLGAVPPSGVSAITVVCAMGVPDESQAPSDGSERFLTTGPSGIALSALS